MKSKLLYICLLAIFSAGFYLLGSYTHQTAPISTYTIAQAVNSDPRQFYSSFVDGPCPFVNTPDTEACITSLASSTLAEADTLAHKLAEASPGTNTDQFVASYYDELRASVRSAQKARNTYLDAICGLNGLLSYGGTGMGSDIQACRYYYAQLYLNLLKDLDKPIKHL